MANIPAPRGLSAKGKRIWKDVTSKYELRVDELDTLEDVCRESDLIEQLEAALAGMEIISTGSMGQDVVNPLVAELRQHRATKKSLWSALKLPEDSTGIASVNQQREAAQSKWAAAHGKGA